MEILRVEHVGLTYQAKNGEVSAFEDISFAVEEGEFLSIVGPSGCGKSTLLSVIAGLLPATRGEVYVKGERVHGTSPHIGYMLQRDNLLEWRTILSNVLFGLEIRGTKTPQTVARQSACWRRTGFPPLPINTRASSLAACASAPASSVRWRPGRIFCCWMRPFPPWIIKRAFPWPRTCFAF